MINTASTSAGTIGPSGANANKIVNSLGEFVVHKDDFPSLSSVTTGNVLNTITPQKRQSIELDSNQILNSTDTVSKDTRYGLLGLLDVIRMTNKDQSLLALGNDLTAFGLNLTWNIPQAV